MDIYIRHIDDNTKDLLHSGTLDEAQQLMSDMRIVGVVCGDRDREFVVNHQYCVDEDVAYLEIIVGGEK